MITYPPIVLALHLLGIAAGLGAAVTLLMAWDRGRTAGHHRGHADRLTTVRRTAERRAGNPAAVRDTTLRLLDALAGHASAEHQTTVWLWWCLGCTATSSLTTWLT